jgi:hypothetical protein
MLLAGSVVLSVGLALVAMGIRFYMVRDSLKIAKPSDKHLVVFKKQYSVLLPGGIALFLVGILGPFLFLPGEYAKAIANAGGVIFGLGIPQFVQGRLGKESDDQWEKNISNIETTARWTAFGGLALVIASGVFL